mmetsp:Transcript_35382/g.65478  ORF Transcript_35382/g.65478 Transcript_35382/m.65478 type:complete len:210 (+) Transcript_35382:670-1299(+)
MLQVFIRVRVDVDGIIGHSRRLLTESGSVEDWGLPRELSNAKEGMLQYFTHRLCTCIRIGMQELLDQIFRVFIIINVPQCLPKTSFVPLAHLEQLGCRQGPLRLVKTPVWRQWQSRHRLVEDRPVRPNIIGDVARQRHHRRADILVPQRDISRFQTDGLGRVEEPAFRIGYTIDGNTAPHAQSLPSISKSGRVVTAKIAVDEAVLVNVQ